MILMFASERRAPEREKWAFAHNLVALVALLVLGFPVTAGTIKATLVSWVLMMAAARQLILKYFRPQMEFEEIANESN